VFLTSWCINHENQKNNKQRVHHLNETVKLCCGRPRVSQKTVAQQTVMTESMSDLFPAIIHSFICPHTHTQSTVTLCNTQTFPSSFPSCPLTTPTPSLTMATHPRAGTLSLTADRWLKCGEVRFCSLYVCTCCIILDMGCRMVVKSAWMGRGGVEETQLVSNFQVLEF